VTVERITVHRFGMPSSSLSRVFIEQDWFELEMQYDEFSECSSRVKRLLSTFIRSRSPQVVVQNALNK
jgi:hypothetical protein